MNTTVTITLRPPVTTDDDAFGVIVAGYLENLAKQFKSGEYAMPYVAALRDEVSGDVIGQILVEERR